VLIGDPFKLFVFVVKYSSEEVVFTGAALSEIEYDTSVGAVPHPPLIIFKELPESLLDFDEAR